MVSEHGPIILPRPELEKCKAIGPTSVQLSHQHEAELEGITYPWPQVGINRVYSSRWGNRSHVEGGREGPGVGGAGSRERAEITHRI